METRGPKSNLSELLCLSWLPAVLYPSQNFWGPSLAPSNIFEFLRAENTTKNELTTKFCFEHSKA